MIFGGCRTGKRGFGSKAEARREARRVRPRVGRLRPYDCQYCQYWHLTSQKPRRVS